MHWFTSCRKIYKLTLWIIVKLTQQAKLLIFVLYVNRLITRVHMKDKGRAYKHLCKLLMQETSTSAVLTACLARPGTSFYEEQNSSGECRRNELIPMGPVSREICIHFIAIPFQPVITSDLADENSTRVFE